jgi:hypothetical protein
VTLLRLTYTHTYIVSRAAKCPKLTHIHSYIHTYTHTSQYAEPPNVSQTPKKWASYFLSLTTEVVPITRGGLNYSYKLLDEVFEVLDRCLLEQDKTARMDKYEFAKLMDDEFGNYFKRIRDEKKRPYFVQMIKDVLHVP